MRTFAPVLSFLSTWIPYISSGHPRIGIATMSTTTSTKQASAAAGYAAGVPTLTLNDGREIPRIGYGLGTANSRKDVTENILLALKTGYTYLDAAQMYGNNEYIGEALQKWGGKREDLFILQKCGQNGAPKEQNDPRAILLDLLNQTKLQYVDLYLLHSPLLFESLPKTWAVMEELQKEGLAKSIGVSNFREEDILELQKSWKVPPAVNQIEYHPYVWHQPNVQRLLNLTSKLDIKIESYGPLSPLVRFTGGPVDAVVKDIAMRTGTEESQVLLKWAEQKTEGVIVTTSSNAERQKLQLEAITKVQSLSAEDIEAISAAGSKEYHRQFMRDVWEDAKA